MKPVIPILIILLSCIISTAAVSAVSITISPDRIDEGGTISIDISDLMDGSALTLLMESHIHLNGGSGFIYQTNQVTVPFRLMGAEIRLDASPVTEAGFEGEGFWVKKRSTDGFVSITEWIGNRGPGTISFLRAFGEVTSGSDHVDMGLRLSGTKQGADSGLINFGVEGIQNGILWITILVDGSVIENKQIIIGNPVPPPPVADFSGTPVTGTAPLAIQFSDQSTGDPTTWLWTFGDGTVSTEKDPLKTYTTPGTYTVTLTVSNAGGSSSETKAGYITVLSPRPPVAAFRADRTGGTVPLAIQFIDQSGGDPTSWYWIFGDGTTSDQKHPLKTYFTPGTYTVTLIVENDDGSSSATKEGYINATAPLPPVAEFTADTTTGTAPLDVQFSDQSTGGVPAEWLWIFGDGTTSTQQNPLKTYLVSGTFTVSLTVTNDDGSSTETKAEYITIAPAGLPEHSIYIGHTAVSISYLVDHPDDAAQLINLLVGEQDLRMLQLWYRVGPGSVRNIATDLEAGDEDIAGIRSGLTTFIDQEGEAHPI